MILKRTLKLTGSMAGKTIPLPNENGLQFIDGKAVVVLPENEMDNILKYYKRCYGVTIEELDDGTISTDHESAGDDDCEDYPDESDTDEEPDEFEVSD